MIVLLALKDDKAANLLTTHNNKHVFGDSLPGAFLNVQGWEQEALTSVSWWCLARPRRGDGNVNRTRKNAAIGNPPPPSSRLDMCLPFCIPTPCGCEPWSVFDGLERCWWEGCNVWKRTHDNVGIVSIGSFLIHPPIIYLSFPTLGSDITLPNDLFLLINRRPANIRAT